MRADNPILARIAAVQDKYSDSLLSCPNILGLGIGYRKRGQVPSEELCLVVLVRRKLPPEQLNGAELLPRELDGVPLEVFECGDIAAS